jgi:SAM domain (Sterile alpha motif)
LALGLAQQRCPVADVMLALSGRSAQPGLCSDAGYRPLGTAMQQIADWLERLGMSEYAQRFAENDIDIEVLGHLTDVDFDRLACLSGIAEK